MKKETSGTTVTEQVIPQPTRHYIDQIFEETFNKEMQCLEVEVLTINGEILTLVIPKRHITRFSLFLRMAEQEEKFYEYLSKNY